MPAGRNLREQRFDETRAPAKLIALSEAAPEGLPSAPDASTVAAHLGLPDMPGADVLRSLREDPVTGRIPVVVVSADATSGQKARLLGAGALAYLTKPIDVKELLTEVDLALDDRSDRAG